MVVNKQEWIHGWKLWCKLYNLDYCTTDSERAGYNFAADMNKCGWGERPISREAEEGWECFKDARNGKLNHENNHSA